MNIKIKYHFMPWEIDYALLTFMQLKKASYYLSPNDSIYIDSALNLSSYIIDWDNSKLSKEFFKKKYKQISEYLSFATHKLFVYEGDELWGHLDLEKNQIEEGVDYYMSICPDIYFHPSTLAYIIEGAKKIQHQYFVITPQTSKLWDSTWDVLVNPGYSGVPYEMWDKIDPFEIISAIDNNNESPVLEPLRVFKYAGWFDLYSKDYIEKLVPIPQGWSGYGPWDTFSMFASDIASREGLPVNQYLLENQIILDMSTGPFKHSNSTTLYKEMLTLKDVPNQRAKIESRFNSDLETWYKAYKNSL
jgi:hypothetical protein